MAVKSEYGPIAQIAVIVADIEEKAAAWARVFGLPVPEIRVTDPPSFSHTKYRGQSTPARAKLAFFDFGNVSVELIEPIDGPSTWRDQLEAHGDSLHHIAFRISGMPATLDELESQGIRLVQQGEYTGGRYAYLDAGPQLGVILELLESD
jgi:catechol 2,3-dioxygenase-like lactoylglutathione lyase family enzyme